VDPQAPLTPIPQLRCEAVLVGPHQKKLFTPIFKSIPTRRYALDSDFERVDGEVENFVCDIELESTVPDWANVANAAAVICHNAERFF
jgi:hypothetical protein